MSVSVQATVTVRHLFVSPGHNYFGRHGQPAGEHPTLDVPSVRCRAGQGIEGDRFFGYRPDYNGQITFFAWETLVALRTHFRTAAISPAVFRRNVVTEGLPLPTLAGQRFHLGEIEFEGIAEAKPCHWMDTAAVPGAEVWLRGRGGLRAKILSDGVLLPGPVRFSAPGLLDLPAAG